MSESLCGVWVDDDGVVHLSVAGADGSRATRTEVLRPFAWLNEKVTAPADGVVIEPLKGEGPFNRLAQADSLAAFETFASAARETGGFDAVRPLESQFLLQQRARLFRDLSFTQLRRCQLDIETGSSDGEFSDATKPEDRVLAIGLRFGERNRMLVLDEVSAAGEKRLLEEFNAVLIEEDPDVIEGHNIFKFDFDYLRQRAKKLKVPCAWGRFGQKATFRNSRLKVAERWIDFPRCDLPGRTVVDTYLLVQQYDITTRELTSYGLKDVAVYFGITDEDSERTYLAGDQIHATFTTDRAAFLAYLADDLRETKGIADLLLPTYFEQVRTFPILLQEATLRGTTGKIDLLFLEHYYHARQACPVPPEVTPFEGGYTRSFKEGVFKHVLHFDVASLYPSLLMSIGRNPRNDTLGVFIPLLTELRQYRLRYKQLAKSASTEDERAEAQARQSSFKILINSFYGYLGFSGARFGDGELAAEVTRRGRELLQVLIDEFARHGCTILEADTDGIYLSSDVYYDRPEALLEKVVGVLPPGIELEYDGRYEAMFCYKAKNYALYDGKKVTIRGSALRSRGIEPYLKKLGNQLIRFLVGASTESPLGMVEDYRTKLAARALPVTEVAKAEVLSMNPDAYERFITGGGKPRRASAEAALLMPKRPRMGERVAYYITAKEKGKTSDWQRARPVVIYDAAIAPYDPGYYADKLDDWLERYGPFLGVEPQGGAQGELF
ncbi:DNA polymerase domain-containing protein [Rariglobus hedericola]|uniref:DNA-directed DNA polymerase n=1 Tax=Rariglobus hedericola TaxID=2597822 RepID=A0A556QP13_9BACT|nr:DNA polymerase domain-containing protein [Rariglobus hedericola]TSJ78388.1 DNA polymerase [Rariglobus hedericola]